MPQLFSPLPAAWSSSLALQLYKAGSCMQRTQWQAQGQQSIAATLCNQFRQSSAAWWQPVTGFQALTTLRSTSCADSSPSADSTSSSPRLMFHSCKGRGRQ